MLSRGDLNSWQWAKHAWLYSDLLQQLLVLNRGDLNSYDRCTPLWVGSREEALAGTRGCRQSLQFNCIWSWGRWSQWQGNISLYQHLGHLCRSSISSRASDWKPKLDTAVGSIPRCGKVYLLLPETKGLSPFPRDKRFISFFQRQKEIMFNFLRVIGVFYKM